MDSILMRLSPKRTGVMLSKPIKFAGDDDDADKQKKKDEESSNEPSSKTKQPAKKKERMFHNGVEVVDLPTTNIPDPQVSLCGHAFMSFLWYGAFLFFTIQVVFTFFVSYQYQESIALPSMSTVLPAVAVEMRVVCTQQATSAADQQVIINQRVITATTEMRYSNASKCAHRNERSTTITLQRTSTSALTSEFTGTLNATLCWEKDQPFSALPKNPEIFGLNIAVSSPPIPGRSNDTTMPKPLCYVDLLSDASPDFSSGSRLVRRMNVERAAVRVLTLGFFQQFETNARDKEQLDKTKEYLFPQTYDLEGIRGMGASKADDIASIVVFKYTSTAIEQTVHDHRTVYSVLGTWGTAWRLTDLGCWYMGPVLLCLFPRNFAEDAQAGKVDGYTKNLIGDVWQAPYYSWIVQVVFRLIETAQK